MTATTLGLSAESFYSQHKGRRTGVAQIGRRLADMSIPSAFPPEEYDTSHDDLEIANQSINAFLVNSLANTLMLTAFPPNLPICKFSADESKLQEDIQKEPALWAEMQYALSRREEVHRTRLATTKARGAYVKMMKQYLLPGNSLCLWTDLDNPIIYNMHHYVVKRDAKGVPLVTVLEDSISMAVADEDVKEAVQQHREEAGLSSGSSNEWDDTATIYHVQKLMTGGRKDPEWLYWQETEGGYVIPGTEFYSPFDVPPMYPGQLIEETGSDWGLGYCSDYEGDLKQMEELSSSILDGAAALAWFLTFVDPTGQTNLRDVQKADNLDVLVGRAADVTTFTSGKSGDLAAVDGVAEKVARRLGIAFASEAAIQRTGERVTAEEWKRMSLALDKGMESLYSVIAQSVQRWFVLRLIHLHQQEDTKIKPIDKDLVKVEVITGMDGIGRSSDYENLMGLMKDASEILTPQGLLQEINGGDLLRRMAAGRSIKSEGLVKDAGTKAAEQEQQRALQQQQTMLEKGSGPVAQGGVEMLAQMMQQQGDQNVEQ